MALTIDNYMAWANAHGSAEMNAAASLNPNGNLADIKSTTSGLARFFHTSSFTSQRDAVRADFRRALGERFGSRIADAVLRDVGRDLTAATIVRTVNTARLDAMRSALTPTNDRSVNLADGPLVITQQQIGGMNRTEGKALTRFLRTRNAAASLLGYTPAGAKDLAVYRSGVETVCRRLAQVKVNLMTTFINREEVLSHDDLHRLMGCCDDLIHGLEDHLVHVTTLNTDGPLAQHSVDRFCDTWFEAFTRTCTTLQAKVAGNPQAVRVLQDLARTPARDFKDEFELSKDFGKFLGQVIDQSLKDACGANPLGKGEAKKAILKSYGQVLNARPWNVITKTFSGAISGQGFGLTSIIKPGKHIANVGNTYPNGVNGYMCHSAEETQHAVNLAISSLQVTDGAGAPHAVFSGVRHGVHCAWEITDPAQRATANRNRAAEAVKAAFEDYLTKHPNTPAGAVDLPMTSVSLLTPDFARPILAWFKGANKDNEKMMLRDQTAAWQAVSGQPMDITVNGQTYHVTPRIATFNFGVNGGGVGKLSGLIGGWGVSEQMNHAAYDTLREQVQAFRDDATVPLAKRAAALQLFEQIRDILNSGAERKDGHDAYKAAARVAVLTNLIGGVPCWNCKSGKDRTGEMDVECKFLATLIDRGLSIPEPGAELDDDQKMLFRTIALEGGNHEMQEYNTGIAGFKTGGVGSIPERLGGKEAREAHKGAADFVGV